MGPMNFRIWSLDIKIDRSNFLKYIQFLVAIILILFIIYFLNSEQIVSVILKVDIVFLLLAIACYLANNVVMAYRIKKLLQYTGNKVRFKIAFLSHMSGMLLSDFTPARSGYLYTAYALSKRGIPLNSGLASITSTYLYDLMFKILVGFLGLYYIYSFLFSPEMWITVVITAIVIGVLIVGYLLIMYPPRFMLARLGKNKHAVRLLTFGEANRKVQKYFPFILSVSVIGWLFRGLQWYFVAMAISPGIIGLTDALLVNPLLTLLSFVPLTPGGLGIQEMGIIGFFMVIGVDRSVSGTFALLIRAIEIFVDMIGIRYIVASETKDKHLIEFYNAIDGDIDDRAFNSDLLVQRYWQRRRTESIVEEMDLVPDDVVLDIGCGSGVQLQQISARNVRMTIGMDVNRNALIYAYNKKIQNANFIIADAKHLPIKTDKISKIVCAEIIEHLNDPDQLIAESKRVLKPGGSIVITTPNERSIWGIYEILWDIFGRGRNYGETHLKFFTGRELRSMFDNFQSTKVKTIYFIAPFLALTNRELVLKMGKWIDRFFEERNLGVILIMRARK